MRVLSSKVTIEIETEDRIMKKVYVIYGDVNITETMYLGITNNVVLDFSCFKEKTQIESILKEGTYRKKKRGKRNGKNKKSNKR